MTKITAQDNLPAKQRPVTERNYLTDIVAVANTFVRESYAEDQTQGSSKNRAALKEQALKIADWSASDWSDWIEAIARVDEDESEYYRNTPGSIYVRFRDAAKTYVQTTAALALLKETGEDITNNAAYPDTQRVTAAFKKKYPENSIENHTVSDLLKFMMESRRLQQPEESVNNRVPHFFLMLDMMGDRIEIIHGIARNDAFGASELTP